MKSIYLSSTLKDLLPEREAVRQALAGKAVVTESYDADEDSVRRSCLKDVESCEIYVGIIGLRYGFIPPGESKSITELEFDKARACGKRILLFLKNPDFIVASFTDAYAERRGSALIASFRARLSAGNEGFPRPAEFDDPADLKVKLLRSLLSVDGAEASSGNPDPAPPGVTELQKMLATHLNTHWAEISRSQIFLGADVFGDVPSPLTPAKVFGACAGAASPLMFLTRMRGFVGKAGDGSPLFTRLAAQPDVLEAAMRLTLVAAERYIASESGALKVAVDESVVVSTDPRVSAVLAAACFGFGVRLRPALTYPETFVRPSAEEYLHEQGRKLVRRELRAAADRFTLAHPPEGLTDDELSHDKILQSILDYAQEKLGCRLVLVCRESSDLRHASIRQSVLGGLTVPVVFEGVPRDEVKQLFDQLRSIVKPLLDGLLGVASTSTPAETP